MPAIAWKRFRAEVLDLYQPPARSKNTFIKIRSVLEMLDQLKLKTTAELTPAALNRFIRLKPDVKAVTIKGYLSYVSPICAYATAMQYLRINPFSVRKHWIAAAECVDEDDETTKKHLSLEEVGRLLDHLEAGATTWKGARLYALAALFAYTGLRRNEGLYLTLADFDLHLKILYVRSRKCRRLKTRSSAAPVPLPPALCAILARWLPTTGCPWAFPNVTRSGAWTGGALGKRPFDELRAAGLACGIGRVNFLMLRHTFATHAELFRLSEMQLQRVLRHTTPRTSRAHYRHADLINLAESVAAVDFRRPTPPPAIAAGRPSLAN